MGPVRLRPRRLSPRSRAPPARRSAPADGRSSEERAQVHDAEYHDPHAVDEVPIPRDALPGHATDAVAIAPAREEETRDRHEPDEYVQPMQSGEGEERRPEEPGGRPDAAAEQPRVLETLSREERGAQPAGEQKPRRAAPLRARHRRAR